MPDLSAYSSDKLMAANERQLRDILTNYKAEHLPLWKLALFTAYNGLFLAGIYFYGVKLRGKRKASSLSHRDQYSILKLFSKGVNHSLIMIGLYLAGLTVISHNTISLPLLRKLTEIQSTYHSFGLKFDPNYQDYLLFSRMRKFQLSEALISQIQGELNVQKERLIANGGLLPSTVAKIREAEELYKNRSKQLS